VLVAALGLGGYFAFGNSSKTTPTASPTATPTVSASSSPSPAPTSSAIPNADEPAQHCVYTASGTAARKVKFPPAVPDWKATYHASIVTNRGTIGIDLLNSKATCTVNSFVSLATQKYYNNTPCHRLTTAGIFVLQCGDPTGSGQGGPGYAFLSENVEGATYPAGTVAMANTGQPDSNGSQYFLVYKDTQLPPQYTPFGTITSGLGIIQNVAKAGVAGGGTDGHPKDSVQIERVTITKG